MRIDHDDDNQLGTTDGEYPKEGGEEPDDGDGDGSANGKAQKASKKTDIE